MILLARNRFVAHTDATYKYCDEGGNEKDELLKLELIVNFAGNDGMADTKTQVIAPQLTIETLSAIKLLCEESLKQLGAAKADLIKTLFEDRPMREGKNSINIFDES